MPMAIADPDSKPVYCRLSCCLAKDFADPWAALPRETWAREANFGMGSNYVSAVMPLAGWTEAGVARQQTVDLGRREHRRPRQMRCVNEK